ncbi:MAG TPA: methylmalonyl-CoA mutase family protein, partial [Chloroflexota bacterium]|nr:methylmalonyl-CoA mutase family protein [Chloroflexota bacterium]
DLPTQMGYDSDHPFAEGEVGKVGVAIDSLDDMAALFEGIPLDRVSTSMTINATAPILLALYVAVGKRQGVPLEKISGTLQNDILKEYIARGTYIYPPGPSMRLTVDVIEWCTKHAPKWNPISISGYHMREAGSTAVQEIAFTLSNGLAYVEASRARGLDVDAFAPRLSFFFNAHSDFFEEIAKYRAARRLWARLMEERCGARDPRSLALRFHVQTAGSTLTAQQPDVNVVRTTLQALAAVLGGCQSLHTNAMDEALALPTEPAARLALRTQQVIAHETGVASTVDPIGGSYYLESLTDQLERRALELIGEVDRLGGALVAVERGFQTSEIHRSAYEWERRLNEGKAIVVGVNAHVEPGEARPETLRVDEAIAERQRDRLARLRRERDGAAVERALRELEDAARGSTNLVDPIIAAVEAYGTMGEICGVLRRAFGEYRPSFGL